MKESIKNKVTSKNNNKQIIKTYKSNIKHDDENTTNKDQQKRKKKN